MDARLQRIQAAQQQGEAEPSKRRSRFTAQIITSSSNTTQSSQPDEKATEDDVATSARAQAKTAALERVASRVERDELARETDSDSLSDDEELQKMLARPAKPLLKPVFIPKELRGTEAHDATTTGESSLTFSSAEAGSHRDEARALVANVLRRDFEAMHSNKDRVIPDPTAGVFDPLSIDDTDDPAHFDEEFLAWKLRELLRIKEDRDERERLDREREEIERIRSMTEDERRRIDQEKMEEWQAQPKTEYKFLQKYYHKGAFFQEEHKDILGRDYAQPTGGDLSNRDVLPESMQVRNFGKKGRTKWKHLTAEDTTAFDYGWGAKDNPLNQQPVSKMGGMRGDLDHPSKKHKK